MRPFALIRSRLSRHFSSNVPESAKLSLKIPLNIKAELPQKITFVEDKDTKLTTLSNGFRVASQNTFGLQCTIGVLVDAGPRYEVNHLSGVSHFIEKLGFHSTDRFSSRDAFQSEIEQCNAIFDCQISRDFIAYAVSGVSSHVDRLCQAISETIQRPKITFDEVETARRSIGFELAGLDASPPVEPLLNELLHTAAFRGSNTLGLPRYCPKDNLDKIQRDDIINFLSSLFRPERMVLAGVGIDHDVLVKAAEAAFTPWQPSYATPNPALPDSSVAQYCGGSMTMERDLAQYHAPLPEVAHCVIGLEGCGVHDSHFVAACLLNSLLGGGGSFSVGGPGKGMHTRLYSNVLNEHYWANSAQSTHHSYTDTGLLALSGSAEPSHIGRLVHSLIAELHHTANAPISAEELSRAKAQLKSMLLMNLEMRPVMFEDIARQVLATGRRRQPEHWMEEINKVTENDIHELVHRMLLSRPSLVGFGKCRELPSYDEVREALANSPAGTWRKRDLEKRLPNLFKRFV